MSGPLLPFPGSKPLGYGQLAVGSVAVLLSTITIDEVAGIPKGAAYALIQAEVENVRWTDDGVTVPTASLGMLFVSDGEPLGVGINQLRTMKVIAATGSPLLNVSFYGNA